jgi:hypothetical protein
MSKIIVKKPIVELDGDEMDALCGHLLSKS